MELVKRPRGRPWPKGQSGNPDGPKRRPRSLRKLILENLDEELVIFENGRNRRYTKKQLLARQIVDEAIKLKPSSLKQFRKAMLMEEYQEQGRKEMVWKKLGEGRFGGYVVPVDGYKPTLADLIREELEVKVPLNRNGRNRFFTKRELLARAITNGAIKMSRAALTELLLILQQPDFSDSTEPVNITLNIGKMNIKTGDED